LSISPGGRPGGPQGKRDDQGRDDLPALFSPRFETVPFAVLEQADPALVDPGVTAQMERLLDEVLIGQQQMVGAIDAVCAQASRIICRRLQESATTVGASLLGVAMARGADRPPTSAMKRLVVSLAQQQRLQPPRGYGASSAAWRAFLHAPKKDEVRATAQANAKQPAPTRTMYTRRLAPNRGNSVVPPAPIDVHQSQRPDEPSRKANGRKGKVGSIVRNRSDVG
jgi:DNA topoisomerase III